MTCWTIDEIEAKFPNINHFCRLHGFDLAKEMLPVKPAAHYSVGGIKTDLNGKTSVPGLYALGEVASTGLHGANRLASNSLLECIVMPEFLANNILKETDNNKMEELDSEEFELCSKYETEFSYKKQALELENLDKVRKIMSSSMGLVRNKEALEDALNEISKLTTFKAAKFAALVVKSALEERRAEVVTLEKTLKLKTCLQVFLRRNYLNLVIF